MNVVTFPVLDDVDQWHRSMLHGLDALPVLAAVPDRRGISCDAELAARIEEIRGLKPEEWKELCSDLEEQQEIYAAIVLFASFEGIMRRDFEWRAKEMAALHHGVFAKLVSGKSNRFVPVQDILSKWKLVAKTSRDGSFQQAIARVATLYRDERNLLAHGNWIKSTPFRKLYQDLMQTERCFCNAARDF